MILHRNVWQDHSGASHRKNLDTPSLVGCCQGTFVPYSELAKAVAVT